MATTGPPLLWSRPLGVGHSAILADQGCLYTMYRIGNGNARGGPWEETETVIALDARTGRTLWKHTYESGIENFDFGAGPHSTPLLVGDRLFTVGTNKQLHAFDKNTGEVQWAHDLVADFGAPPLLIRANVKAGYGCSPIAYRDTIICSVGGPGQSVMAFHQHDGSVAWRSGDFLFSEAPPILIDVDGQPQLVLVAGASVVGMNPESGQDLWTLAHDPGNDLNFSLPHWGEDNVLFFFVGVQGWKPSNPASFGRRYHSDRRTMVQSALAVYVPQYGAPRRLYIRNCRNIRARVHDGA